MEDRLNNTVGANLFEKFDLSDNVVIYNNNGDDNDDQASIQKQTAQIELAGVKQSSTINQVSFQNDIKRVNSVPIYSQESIEEEEDDNRRQPSNIPFINKVLINFIWGIRQTLNVIIFVKKIKQLSRSHLFKSISRISFNVIGDQSSEYNYYIANNLIQNNEKMSIFQMWRKIRQKRYIFQDCMRKIEGLFYNCFRRVIYTIDPRSRFKVVWDAIVYFILAINIFYVPIYLAWDGYLENSYSEKERIFTLVLNDIPGWVFFFDIVLNFITCYYEEGKLITKRRKIFVNYIKGKFWGDIIVVLPFLINQYIHVRFLNVILLLRINNMIKRMDQFEEMIDLSPNQQLLYDFGKIIVTIIFISHFVGCFYFFVGQIEIQMEVSNNWIAFYNIPRDFFSEYITSIYWATITMVTIGYGDFTPQTNYEKIFVMIVSLVGCCYYAAILSSIGSILSQWQQRSQEKRKKVSVLISYLKKRGVDKTIQYKVKKQIAYSHEKDLDYQHEASNILNTLSTPLQKEIQKDILVRVLRQIKFLSSNYSDVFILHLIQVLKVRECEAGEALLEKDQLGDSIYCVMSGSFNLELDVQSYKQNESALVLDTYNNLDSFGDYCFLTNRPSPGRFVSTTNSQVMVLQKKDFESVIQLYAKDYEFYRMQVDQIQIDSCYKYAQKKCQVCKDTTHFFFKCPHSNLMIYKNKVINRVTLSHSNERETSSRLKYEKTNSLTIIDWVRSSSIQYLFDNDMLDNVESIEALMGDNDEGCDGDEEQHNNPELLNSSPLNFNDDENQDTVRFQEEIREKQESKEEQTHNIRAQTVNYFMKKKKNIQAKESYRQQQTLKIVEHDQRSQSFCGKDEKKDMKQFQQIRNSLNQNHNRREDMQKDPYIPLIQKIKLQDEQMEKDILTVIPKQLDESKRISPLLNFDRMSHFSIYYPKGNYTEISKQKKRIRYFSKQKFKQSVEAIRKLLVFRSKMEHSSVMSSSQNMSLPNGKNNSGSLNKEDVVLYNKSMQQHFRKKGNTMASSSFSKPVYTISDEKEISPQQEFKITNETSIN